MFIVAGPPGSGKSTAFPVAGFGVDYFNADDRAAALNAGSYLDIRWRGCENLFRPGRVSGRWCPAIIRAQRIRGNCAISRSLAQFLGVLWAWGTALELHSSDSMCLAVPGRVVDILGEDPAFRSANVDFCGIRKTVNLAFTPEARLGDFVLVHVGFAIARVDEEEARRTYNYLEQIGALAEEGLGR